MIPNVAKGYGWKWLILMVGVTAIAIISLGITWYSSRMAEDRNSDAHGQGKKAEPRSFFWTVFRRLLFGFLTIRYLELGRRQVAKR